MNRWRHIETGTLATFVGEDRDANGTPYAVMQTDDGSVGRIDPRDLMCIPPVWEKVAAESREEYSS